MRCAHVYRDTPKARERDRVGKQCGKNAVHETRFCQFHGGNSSQVIDAARRARMEAEIEAEASRALVLIDAPDDPSINADFVRLWAEDHPMLDPFSLLLWDIRRSGARIEWFDTQIAKLEEERDLFWGITKQEKINATEFKGTNKTYEARENILVKMQNDERKRLQALRDEWQNNRFEAAKIAGYGAFRESMRNAIGAVLREFELDPTDPAIQDRLRSALEALPDPILGITAPEVKQRAPR